MITISILIVCAIGLMAVAAISIVIGGAGLLIAFGDILIAAAFIYFVVRYLIKRRK